MNRFHCLFLLAISQFSASYMTLAAEGEKPAAAPARGLSEEAKEALASFRLKQGFRIELVAAEPLVASPVAMAFDENGRLFVVEMRDYPDRRDQRLGQIRLLEDTDGDGVFDSGKTYGEDLAWPSAVACYGGGVFVAATPEIIYFQDSQHDGVADVRRVVFNGFGGGTSKFTVDALLNNFNWGLDNRIHGAAAGLGGQVNNLKTANPEQLELGRNDFAFDPKALTIAAEAGPGVSGLSFDSRGRRWLSDFTHPLKQPMYDPRYLSRNTYFPKAPAIAELRGSGAPIFHSVTTDLAGRVRPGTLATNGFAPGWPTKARGCVLYRGGLFPPTYSENAFFADSAAGAIHYAVLREEGLGLVAERATDEVNTEFLLSRDTSFQPMQIINGPEGALYIADLHGGGDHGRIYRIIPDRFRQPKLPQLGKATTYELVAALAHTNGWYRDTAARLLFERRDPAAVSLLTNMLRNSRLPLARLHALHSLAGMAALNESHVIKGLTDLDERLREHAVLLSENLIRNGAVSDTLWGQLKSLAGDPSIRMRYQLAFTLGEIHRPDKIAVLADLLRRDFGNPWFQTAALSSLTENQGDLFVALAADARLRGDPAGLALLQKLLTMIGLSAREEEAARVVDFFDRARLEPQQTFTLLYALGEGLRRVGSGFPVIDRQNRLQRFYDQTIDATLNDSLPEPLRLAAIRLRGVSPYVVTGTGDFFQLLFGTGQSETVQSAVISTLARYNNPNIPSGLIARWQILTPALRKQAVTALLARYDGVGEVVKALENGTIRQAEVSPTQIEFLRYYRDPTIRQHALQLFGPSTRERREALERFRPALRLPGNTAAGRQIFLARCAACHRLGSEGQSVGPDLADARVGGKERVLSSIVQPNLEVRPDYLTFVVETKGGENLIGLLSEENAVIVTVRQPNTMDMVLPRANIESINPQPWSLMPAGLEEGLTAQSMADLLDYIMSAPR